MFTFSYVQVERKRFPNQLHLMGKIGHVLNIKSIVEQDYGWFSGYKIACFQLSTKFTVFLCVSCTPGDAHFTYLKLYTRTLRVNVTIQVV